MEGWQKGADAVIKMSSAGKERYFQNFPDRKEWFQANYPEHFGRSAAAATSSLKKVTKAKQQKQRLAAIRQAAEKRDQSTVLTPERRLMAQRRLQSGEGLAGGMDTVADIRKTIAAGMPVRSGGIGSLFEQEENADSVYQKDGKWYFNGVPYKDQNAALEAFKNSERTKQDITSKQDELSKIAAGFEDLTSKKDSRQTQKSTTTSADGNKVWTGSGWISKDSFGALPPDRATNFRNPISGQGLDAPSVSGTDWPSSNPDWGANLGMTYPTNAIDTATELKLLQTPQTSAGRRSDRAYRKPFSNYISIRADEEYVKELAEKTIQECMPMPGSMMPLKMRILSMKSKDEGSEQTEAKDEPGEYDYEGDMAKSQLRSIMHNSKMLHDMLEDNTNLPEWVQSKLTLAEDYILTAANYMRGELDRMDEEVLKEGASHWQYNGTLYPNGDEEQEGKRYTITVKRGDDLGDVLNRKNAFKKLSNENPHLESHEVEAILNGSGEDVEDVEVEQEGKKYKHRIYNQQEPDMIYMDEEVEQVDEAKKRLKPSYWRAEWRLGTETEVDKNNQKIYNRLAKTDPEKAAAFQENLMKMKKKDMKEEVEQIEEGKGYSPGWMLKKDPKLGKELNDKINLAKKRQASYGKPEAGISVMPPTDYGLEDPVAGGKFNAYMQKKKDELAAQAPATDYNKDKPNQTMGAPFITPKPNQKLKNYHTSDLPFDPNAERPEMSAGKHPEQYRYVRNLARKAMKAGIAATAKPETAQELVAQHNALHNPQGEVMEEGAGAARKVNPMDDLVKKSMLPDKSVIPPGKGFGDDIKKQKISKKVGKAILKKRMARPTDNPSENEMIPKSMLPDTPGYPQGYQMEEQVVKQTVEQQLETPVVEENTNPFVSAGSKFLTRTSTRLVYGDKND